MSSQRITLALAIINLALLLAVLAHLGTAVAQGEPSVLRGRVLELVDDRGELRANLKVEPGGEVVLRLLDETGTIRAKLGAGKGGSGLVLLNDATEVGVHILAQAEGSSMKLANKDARQKVIAP